MSCVRGESAAQAERGEGVYIEAPQKLAVVEVLCACRNFRPVHFQTTERGLSETTQYHREGGSDVPTLGRNIRPLLEILGLVSNCASCRDFVC